MWGLPPSGQIPRRNGLVTLGLAMVVLGWTVLVADLLLGDAELHVGGLVAVLALKADIASLAQLLVVTGLGLAILGGLREGFGALNGFFDAVLQRSTAQRPSSMPDAGQDVIDDDLDGSYAVGDRVPGERHAQAHARNYTILPDGSVEVETLLGTRIFANMDEARDFIR